MDGYQLLLRRCIYSEFAKEDQDSWFQGLGQYVYSSLSSTSSANHCTAMFYNNLLPIPVLLAASLFLEDWSSANLAKNFPPEQRFTIISVMIFSGMTAVFISYTQGWCLRVGTSTTFSMVGALNKLPLSIVGLIFFDAPVTFGSVSAIICGFVSGIVYTLAKLQQSTKAKMSLPTTAPKA